VAHINAIMYTQRSLKALQIKRFRFFHICGL